MNYFVSKEIRINVRTTEDIKRDIEITARLRGLTVSSLINSLAVKAIREEKAVEPQAFEQTNTTKPQERIAVETKKLDDERVNRLSEMTDGLLMAKEKRKQRVK